MAGLFRAQDVVDVKNIVAVFVVVAIVLDALARFSENSAGITRCLVFKTRVADSVRRRQMSRQSL